VLGLRNVLENKTQIDGALQCGLSKRERKGKDEEKERKEKKKTKKHKRCKNNVLESKIQISGARQFANSSEISENERKIEKEN
jgi:hypothetical protein